MYVTKAVHDSCSNTKRKVPVVQVAVHTRLQWQHEPSHCPLKQSQSMLLPSNRRTVFDLQVYACVISPIGQLGQLGLRDVSMSNRPCMDGIIGKGSMNYVSTEHTC